MGTESNVIESTGMFISCVWQVCLVIISIFIEQEARSNSSSVSATARSGNNNQVR